MYDLFKDLSIYFFDKNSPSLYVFFNLNLHGCCDIHLKSIILRPVLDFQKCHA